MRVSCYCLILALALCEGCRPSFDQRAVRGAADIERYGCGSCHTVAGIRGANGLVGPPLTGIGSRMYVAGMLQNTPDNVATWIFDPKAINPKTAMPKVGASQQEASDMAAFLSTRK